MKKWMTAAILLAMSMFMGMTAYAGEWKQDRNGLWYEETKGEYIISDWMKIDGKWYYFDESGYMQTGWLQSDDMTYYLDPASGTMLANATRIIDGRSCRFDDSGAMIGPVWEADEWNGGVFTSSVMNYQLTVPEDYTALDLDELMDWGDFSGIVCEFAAARDDMELMILGMYYPLGSNQSAASVEEMAALYAQVLADDGGFTPMRQASVDINGQVYEFVKLSGADGRCADVYIRQEGEHMLLLQIICTPECEPEAEQILASLRTLD